jgi:EAL domain-containing protein (putative c-di-GMP-specific phosphodiesterase class I)
MVRDLNNTKLSRLKTFPIDTLKIGQSFVRYLPDDYNDVTIVKSIIGLAKGLDLDIVAEGIENKEQLEFLQSNNCGIGQGYYFSKPSAPHVIEEMLTKKVP